MELMSDAQAGSTVVATRASPVHFARLHAALAEARPDVGVRLLSTAVPRRARELLETVRLLREMHAFAQGSSLTYKVRCRGREREKASGTLPRKRRGLLRQLRLFPGDSGWLKGC
jgi:hypothetical protein